MAWEHQLIADALAPHVLMSGIRMSPAGDEGIRGACPRVLHIAADKSFLERYSSRRRGTGSGQAASADLRNVELCARRIAAAAQDDK
jgi:hypothetical protein